MSTDVLSADALNTEWRTLANCQGLNDAMYPDWGDKVAERAAKRVCRSCPVKRECLNEALKLEDFWGVQGELNGRERRHLVQGDKGQPCTDCGENFHPRLKNQKRCNSCAQARDGHRYGVQRRECTACGTNAHINDATGQLGRHRIPGTDRRRAFCRGEAPALQEVAA